VTAPVVGGGEPSRMRRATVATLAFRVQPGRRLTMAISMKRDWQGVAMAVCIALGSVSEYRLGLRSSGRDGSAEERPRAAAARKLEDKAMDGSMAGERNTLESCAREQPFIEQLQAIAGFGTSRAAAAVPCRDSSLP
jgi:hypothetical protein